MNKIFLFITTYACIFGLVGFLFHLDDYDLFAQLSKIQGLGFVNPLNNFQTIIDAGSKLTSIELEWYEYIFAFFNFIISILSFPILVIVDTCIDLALGLQATMYILGFQEVLL